MTDREKLIEILRKPIFPNELLDPTEAVVDYLLANGVTVQKWIPVTERLPDTTIRCICIVSKYNVPFLAYWTGKDWRYTDTVSVVHDITHWMPLPEPPKEEQ